MTTIFFTSDTHFGHSNVIRYCNRPFKDVVEMDDAIVSRWNAKVKPGDVVYHIGDFALVRPDLVPGYVKRLNGQIHLIHGNHDRFLKDKHRDYGFAWVGPYKEVKPLGEKIVLCHYPFMSWNKSHHGSWNLHGHCHGSIPKNPAKYQRDVGVDVWNYTPISLDEIEAEMKTVQWKPVSHHQDDA